MVIWWKKLSLSAQTMSAYDHHVAATLMNVTLKLEQVLLRPTPGLRKYIDLVMDPMSYHLCQQTP